MTAKIKLTQALRTADGKEIFQRQVSTGDYEKDIISMEDYQRNPDMYEVAESTSTAKAILAERISVSEGVRTKRVKFDASTDPRHSARYAKELAAHNIRVAEAKRRKVSLDVIAQETEQETFRKRVAAGFKALGLNDQEASIAAEQNQDKLRDAWDILLGKDRGKIAREL
jgi:hypothetical protein